MVYLAERDQTAVAGWEERQKRYQHGVFLILPPDSVRQMVNTQREKYDPVSAGICEAHISVTQPLQKALTDQDQVKIEDALRGFSSFDIHYGHLKSFLPYPCIWYEIQPAKKILELRKAMHNTGLFNLVDGYIEGFVPHLTITKGQSGPEVNPKLLEQLQAESLNGVFRCSGITHMVPDDHFHFRQQGFLPLDG